MTDKPTATGVDNAEALVSAAHRLADGVRAHAADIERDRRLPTELVAAIADAGLFRACVPRALGGSETNPAIIVQAIEALAQADGSAGWALMIGATSGAVSAYLPDDEARAIYGADPKTISGGVLAPLGKATVVEGGYRVSGRWPFASGCEHSDWLMGGCMITRNGALQVLPNGTPETRTMLFPRSQVEIIDTWTVSGLRGTGSHDIAVADVFVPAGHSFSLTTDRPRHPAPLYAFPIFGLLALGIAGVALGIARNGIDELTKLAGAKTPTGSRRRLADRALVQVAVAQAEATLRAARALMLETIAEAWEAAQAEGAIAIQQRAMLRLAATHATASAAAVVDSMYNAGGGTSVYASSPLQRCFRDIHVVTQHMMVAPTTYELTGRILLGCDADTTML